MTAVTKTAVEAEARWQVGTTPTAVATARHLHPAGGRGARTEVPAGARPPGLHPGMAATRTRLTAALYKTEAGGRWIPRLFMSGTCRTGTSSRQLRHTRTPSETVTGGTRPCPSTPCPSRGICWYTLGWHPPIPSSTSISPDVHQHVLNTLNTLWLVRHRILHLFPLCPLLGVYPQPPRQPGTGRAWAARIPSPEQRAADP